MQLFLDLIVSMEIVMGVKVVHYSQSYTDLQSNHMDLKAWKL